MNSDVVETFVKARKNPYLPLIYVGISLLVVAVGVVIFALYQLIGFFMVVLIAGIGIGAMVYLRNHNRLEYEFSIALGEFTLSEIRNETGRKKVLAFEIGGMQDFRRVEVSQIDEKRDKSEKDVRVLYCFGDEDETVYNFRVRSAEGDNYNIYIAYDQRIMRELAKRNFGARKVLGESV